MKNYLEKEKTTIVNEISHLKSKSTRISIGRLLLMVLSILWGIIAYYSVPFLIYLPVLVVFISLFIILIRLHFTLRDEIDYKERKSQFLQNELEFTTGIQRQFYNGEIFQDYAHPYANDLDIFLENGLFQHVSRCNTSVGKQVLANRFLNGLTTIEILESHESIKELSRSEQVYRNIRTDFFSHTAAVKNDEKLIDKLRTWIQTDIRVPLWTQIWRIVGPGLLLVSITLSTVLHSTFYLSIAGILFSLNTAFAFALARDVMKEVSVFDQLGDNFKAFSKISMFLSKLNFESSTLQESITFKSKQATIDFKKLGEHISSLDSIGNLMVSLFLNGTVCFHLHAWKNYCSWKKETSFEFEHYLTQIGLAECLFSFANFHEHSRTDSAFSSFPVIGKTFQFEDASHPLISKKNRISNSLDFSQQHFVILTGSNMSGKSTFLRTLGVVHVLACAGASVPAKNYTFAPIPLIASMRLVDSLADSSSYFFAEVKRLELIIKQLNQNECFILLDEILRGTNSDDKLEGTKAVVQKLIQLKANGIIATHDLEVCEIQNEHPQTVQNKCFEVEQQENELYFDYVLRDGVCQNKSASFIMKKRGII